MRRSRALTAVAATGLVVAARRHRSGTAPSYAEGVPARPVLAARPQTVTADDGVALHVEVHGPADASATVVLVHGYLLSTRLWDLQVSALTSARPDLRVVAYDHRGHGRSGATSRPAAELGQLGEDLRTVLDAVAPEGPVVLVGHSMGGMTVMSLAERHPDLLGDRVVGAAFVSTSAGRLSEVTYGLPTAVARAFVSLKPRLDARAVAAEVAGRPPKLSEPMMRWLNFGRDPHPQHVRLTLDVLAATTARTTAFFWDTFAQHDRVAALAALAGVRTTVLVGGEDRLCPVGHARAIAAAVPGSELVVYPGAGHMLVLERAAEVNRRLVELCGVLPVGVEPRVPAAAPA